MCISIDVHVYACMCVYANEYYLGYLVFSLAVFSFV